MCSSEALASDSFPSKTKGAASLTQPPKEKRQLFTEKVLSRRLLCCIIKLPKITLVWKKAVEKNLTKLDRKIETVLPVIAERYGFTSEVPLDECHDALVRQAQWLNLEFAVGKGHHKTRLQRDIETLEALTSDEGILLFLYPFLPLFEVFSIVVA